MTQKKKKKEPESIESFIINCLLGGVVGVALIVFPDLREEFKKATGIKDTEQKH